MYDDMIEMGILEPTREAGGQIDRFVFAVNKGVPLSMAANGKYLYGTNRSFKGGFMRRLQAWRAPIFVGVAFSLGGCMHLKDVAYANREVPTYFTARNFISDQQMAPLGGDIQWFAGRLGYKRDDGKFVFTKRLIVGTPEIKITTLQKSPEYHSVLTAGFHGSSLLPMLQADASGDTASDYEITDIANVVVPDSAMPTRAAAARAVPELPAGRALWWVNVVGLSVIRYSVATNSKGSTSLNGAAFQAGGTVYDNLTVGSYIPLACVLVQPMNAKADAELAAGPIPSVAVKPSAPPLLTKRLSELMQATVKAVGDGSHVESALQTQAAQEIRWRPTLTNGKGLLSWTAGK